MGDLADEIEAVPESRYRQERDTARAQLRNMERENAELSRSLDFVQRIEAAEFDPPKWLKGGRSTKKHKATVCLMLSDLHLDEVVDVDETMGINKYDRAIAEIRLQEVVRRAVMVARDYFSGMSYDGMTLFWGGDIFTGEIHEELTETNEATLLESVVYWQERLEAVVDAFASEFGKLHNAFTYGNHGRLPQHRRTRAKKRHAQNIEWLVYNQMERHFRGNKSITWQIPKAADVIVPVYDTRYLLTHGDQFKGGSGIAGALSPLMLGVSRKTKRQAAVGSPFDMMLAGHWHQYMSLPGKGLLVNGSLKGVDEYSMVSNFEPELAQQAFWLTTPEHGPTFSAPIIVQDRVREGW